MESHSGINFYFLIGILSKKREQVTKQFIISESKEIASFFLQVNKRLTLRIIVWVYFKILYLHCNLMFNQSPKAVSPLQ